MTPDTAVATVLVNAALGTLGTSLFTGPERPSSAAAPVIPESCIFVITGGGRAPIPYCGTGTSYYVASVTVINRCALQTYATGQATARSILDALHTTDVSGYVYCLAKNSEPEYLGQNETGQPRWASTFELSIVQA